MSQTSFNKRKPYDLTVEYRENPIGIDAAIPRFSWKLPEGTPARSACEIDAGCWNSGRVAPGESVNVEWAGPELVTGQRVSWKVRVGNELGEVSEWSEPATFTMGVMKPEDWGARWISLNPATCPEEDMGGAKWITGDRDENGEVTLVRKFKFSGVEQGEFVELVHAAYPQQLIRINGKDCYRYTGHIWNPELIFFRDITPWLEIGENVVEVKIIEDETGCVESSERAFIAKIEFPGGRKIVTDSSWSDAREIGELRDTDYGQRLRTRRELVSPAFEKVFDVKKPVSEATLFITGAGYYEASLNSVRVGDKVIDPPPTDYTKRVLYSTYHVEDSLKAGENKCGYL